MAPIFKKNKGKIDAKGASSHLYYISTVRDWGFLGLRSYNNSLSVWNSAFFNKGKKCPVVEDKNSKNDMIKQFTVIYYIFV